MKPTEAQPDPERYTRLCDEGVEMGDHFEPAAKVLDTIDGERCLCVDCYEDTIAQAERAAERSFEAYHGASTPQTPDEVAEVLWRQGRARD